MTTDIIGWVLLVIISIVGWYLSGRQNSKAIKQAADKNQESVSEAAKAAAIAATKEFTQVTDTVKSLQDNFKGLACVKDSGYMMETGKLIQKVDSLKEGQDKLEDKLDAFLMQMGRPK